MANKKEEFLISTFEVLKGEQLKRIEFRDRMIYLTLVAIGGVFSFAIENSNYNSALLVLPFIITVLGWMYLVNDIKITKIGNYCSKVILPKFEGSKKEGFSLHPTWEEYYRSSTKRKLRKNIQLIVDLSVFCLSSLFSIAAFYFIEKDIIIQTHILIIIEVLIIFFLGSQIVSNNPIYKK